MRWFFFTLLLLPFAASGQMPDFTQLARDQGAAVVNIGSAYITPPVLPDLPHDDLLREFLDRLSTGELVPDFEPRPLGSGFLIRSDGYIVTGAHVVEDSFNDEVVVRLADRREFVGRVIGSDAQTDIALVKIDADGLPAVRIGDPKRLQPGEWVATIGSPFGFEHSVTAGIVSAVGRAIPTEAYIPFIQSDVAMNPGNSGGPLFNLRGEVVGVNSLIFSASGGYMGLSFAVPIDVALGSVEQLLAHGKVTRGRIGVRLQEVSAELDYGLLVQRAEGAARRAGLLPGDVILAVNGEATRTLEAFQRAVAKAAGGDVVALLVERAGSRAFVPLRIP
ncbi:MAG: hypothetical protein A3G81_17550 [Betaproteobacteria bacterium RIFCSPLOWO2_12_FULL_65_14]|nr:MAG: hypothetical protein A3G81_17550 [Betaproteobacteria bacterium RIFCSPLOWO2_12_FULL_65_14]